MAFVFFHVLSVALFVGMGASVLRQAISSELAQAGSHSAAIVSIHLHPVTPSSSEANDE